MKTLLLLVVFFMPFNFWAQSTSVEYLVEKDGMKQNFILDIENDKAYFYSDEYCKNSDDEIYNYVIVEAQNDNFIFHDQLEILNVKCEKKIKLNWQLSSEKKEIEGVKLSKATTHYKGRTWTAWFDSSVLGGKGPFVFNNLPGLVYEVESEKMKISLIKINKALKKCAKIPQKEKKIDEGNYDKYNQELLKRLNDGFKKNTHISDHILLQDVLEKSLRKDLFREFL